MPTQTVTYREKRVTESIPHELLAGMDDAARIQVAQRVGSGLAGEQANAADRRAAELLAHILAKDGIEQVRCELSMAIRHSSHVPRDLALMLAHDVDSVADWQSLMLTISRSAHIAVARRESMNDTLALALAELGDSVVAETLVENPMALMNSAVCDALLDRFAAEIWVIDKLAGREDLLAETAVKLTTCVSAAAREKLAATYRLDGFTPPLVAEDRIATVLNALKPASMQEMIAMANTLHREKRLTPFLLLAALQDRHIVFTEAALSVISRRNIAHVRSVLERADAPAVQDLLASAGVPEAMLDDFQAEIVALRQAKRA
jgi:uncharacterized protein (DUF2336 family)